MSMKQQVFKLPDDPTPGEAEAFRLGALFGLFVLISKRDVARASARERIGRLVERGAWHEVIANCHMERGGESADQTLDRTLRIIEDTTPESLIAQARAVTVTDGHAYIPKGEVFSDTPPIDGAVDLAEFEAVKRGLALACQEIARLRMQLCAEQTGEDARCDDNVRLGGADEMRDIMERAFAGEMPV